MNILEKVLQHWLDQYRHEKRLERINMDNTTEDTAAIINIDTLNKLKTDMDELFEEVIQSVFTSIQSSLDELAKHPDDARTITRLFHSIKSPAASLGAEQLAAQAAAYEKQSRTAQLQDMDEALQRLMDHVSKVQARLSELNILHENQSIDSARHK